MFSDMRGSIGSIISVSTVRYSRIQKKEITTFSIGCLLTTYYMFQSWGADSVCLDTIPTHTHACRGDG